jgi:hypothetical protein
MKNLKILAVFAALVFAMSLGMQAQPVECWDIGYVCGGEISGQYTFYHPEAPYCPIHIDYKYEICRLNGVIVGYTFRLIGISFPDIWDCDRIKALLDMNVELLIGNQLFLYEIWKLAFKEITDIWFNDLNPTNYPCGTSSVIFRTVVPGGCAAWAWAWRYNATQAHVEYRFIPARCTDDGCCMIDRILCWNTQTEQIDEDFNITILGGDNCEETQPLENPFENYGPEWHVQTPTPCQQMCYVWAY